MKKHHLHYFLNRSLEAYAGNKTNAKARRTRAFKIAQKIRAAHYGAI